MSGALKHYLHLGTRLLPVQFLVIAFLCVSMALAGPGNRVSQPIAAVLREPLPPEDLACDVGAEKIMIEGPTFRYTVDRTTGTVRDLQVMREGRVVVSLQGPADIVVDAYHLGSGGNLGKTRVTDQSKQKVVLATDGVMKDPAARGPDIPYTMASTFFNDGVVVSEITLRPREDFQVNRCLRHRLTAHGRFSHYFHKRRDDNGMRSEANTLPPAGQSLELTTLTSCLEVFSQEAAFAIFTDRGATHLAAKGLQTAVIKVHEKASDQASVSLTQNIINIGPSGTPFLIGAGEPFTFRVGICIAPNRLPHRRRRDLRMYIWIGDQKTPYPTNQEILDAAHLGFTLFQMHRVGAPGEPRPPAGELERVIKKVHEAGMLFIWEVNADMIFANLKRAAQMRKTGTWSLWQGFNYGGRYKAAMDPYCDLLATCLASPNGLADFRIAKITEMLKRYDVDGIYVDDNLAYANCRLWKEHGHPEKVYDCLIELHEMNWRRRQVLREKCSHMVLIDHCSKALVLPIINTFDVHLFGEGYNISLDYYRDYFMSVKNVYGQGCLWAGDTEGARVGVQDAYNMDLLTGGGQYSYTDWRLYPKKFPYASGVRSCEPLFVRTFNLAQYYFGMYESRPYYFATSADIFSTTAPETYATVYRNTTWGDYLIPVVNISGEDRETSLMFHAIEKLGIDPRSEYVIYDVNRRFLWFVSGSDLVVGIRDIWIPGRSLQLLHLRKVPGKGPYHLWGGKRISESWDPAAGRLSLRLQGPPGLKDSVFIRAPDKVVKEVRVDGNVAAFFWDKAWHVAAGTVTFGRRPIAVEVIIAEDSRTLLPKMLLLPDELSGKRR